MSERSSENRHDAAATAFRRLVALMHRLRAPGGCPWDAEQTHATIKKYVIEEAYEVVEAIDSEQDDDLCEELGDLLLQVVFHAEMAGERSAFAIDDVVEQLCEKLVRRHPHVFAGTVVGSSDDVVTNWARIKAIEKSKKNQQPISALNGVPRALPALLRAHRIGQKTAVVGFDWDEAGGVREKLAEELRELDAAIRADDPEHIAAEMGDVLFTTVSLARHLDLDAESVLHRALDRFERRFREMEQELERQEQSIESATPEHLERTWDSVKRRT